MNSNGLHLLFLFIFNQVLSCIALKCFHCFSTAPNNRDNTGGKCAVPYRRKVVSCEGEKNCLHAEFKIQDETTVFRSKIMDCTPKNFCETMETNYAPIKIAVLHCHTCDSDYCNHSPRDKMSRLALPLTFLLHFCQLKV